jgi:hypothetical protein
MAIASGNLRRVTGLAGSLLFMCHSAFAQNASGAASQSGSPHSTDWPAVILASSVISAVITGGILIFTEKFKARENERNMRNLAQEAVRNAATSDSWKRQSELAFLIASKLDENPHLARRFAVGVVKVIADPKADEPNTRGKVLFIPFNARVTIGRDTGNDLVLPDSNEVSRWHCGLVSDKAGVYIEDFSATNCTEVDGKPVDKSKQLLDGNEITLGPYKLRFQVVRRQEDLSMTPGMVGPGK